MGEMFIYKRRETMGIFKKVLQNENVTDNSTIEQDEFQIPKLVLCRTPGPEEMERRKKISALRKQYGVRIEDTKTAY